jgi:Glycosyltransferase family 87
LLLHRRNPYSAEITREIQQGYYGRPLDSTLPNDPKDQQGFAYPAYVVFLLAPTVKLPFDTVQIWFRWFLVALAGGSILLWLRVLRWKAPAWTVIILIVFVLGWWPMVQGLKLQQLSLLVAGLLAVSGACVAGGWFLLSGGLLALATIKPQLTWLLVLWLLLWVASDWRSRRRFVFGFGFVMLLLLGGAQLLLPGWLRMFVEAIGRYHLYTQNQSVLVWWFGSIAGRVLEVVSVALCAVCIWPVRREPATSLAFGQAFSLVLALAGLVVPMFAPYNQVLLVPAILALLQSEASRDPVLPAIRLTRAVGCLLLVLPSIATVGSSLGYLGMVPAVREQVWHLLFLYSNFLLPIFTFGLALHNSWGSRARTLRDNTPAE